MRASAPCVTSQRAECFGQKLDLFFFMEECTDRLKATVILSISMRTFTVH